MVGWKDNFEEASRALVENDVSRAKAEAAKALSKAISLGGSEGAAGVEAVKRFMELLDDKTNGRNGSDRSGNSSPISPGVGAGIQPPSENIQRSSPTADGHAGMKTAKIVGICVLAYIGLSFIVGFTKGFPGIAGLLIAGAAIAIAGPFVLGKIKRVLSETSPADTVRLYRTDFDTSWQKTRDYFADRPATVDASWKVTTADLDAGIIRAQLKQTAQIERQISKTMLLLEMFVKEENGGTLITFNWELMAQESRGLAHQSFSIIQVEDIKRKVYMDLDQRLGAAIAGGDRNQYLGS